MAPSYELYAEETYRRICREQLGREYRIVGEWLGKTGTIDVIGSDGRGRVAAARCAYSRAMVYEDYENLLAFMKRRSSPAAISGSIAKKDLTKDWRRPKGRAASGCLAYRKTKDGNLWEKVCL